MEEYGIPESDYIEHTVTLRRLRLPTELHLTRRGLVRWFALSMGLISPRETRQSILSLLDAFFYFAFTDKQTSIDDLKEFIENKSVFKDNMNEKTIRYHITQLKKRKLIHGKKGKYNLVKHPFSDKPSGGILFWINENARDISERVEKGITHLEKTYNL